MIELLYDLDSDSVAWADAPATLKATSGEQVSVTFSAAPPTVSTLALALGTGGSSPSVLAYVDTFTQQSATVWTGVLNCNDSRLLTYLSGLSVAQVQCELELGVTLGGRYVLCPNLDVIVQPAIVTGPTSSDGGPIYITSGALASALAAYLAIANNLSELTASFAAALLNLGVGTDGSWLKYGSIACSSGASGELIAFTTAFAGSTAPKLFLARLSPPTGGEMVDATVLADTISVTGATVDFGTALPASGYRLDWLAILS